MKFFYSDTEPKEPYKGKGAPDVHRAYLVHLSNWFVLKRHYALGSLPEKLQATRELVICERKMKFWADKPSFQFAQVEGVQKELSTMWGIPYVPNTFDEVQQKWLRQK